MSKKYPGGVLSKTTPVPAGPYATGVASGMWSMEDVVKYKQQGIWPTPGLLPNYIDDVFSTYLYTGTGAAQTITNNIDLSTYGGLVWEKSRTAAQFNGLVDTVRGVASCLVSSSAGAVNTVAATGISAFNSTGYTKNTNGDFNTSTYNYVSWTFRKQAKFFDIVTYTGNGVTGREIPHSLGSAPGCIMVKCTSNTEDWKVYHRSLGSGTGNGVLRLNSNGSDQGTGYGLYNWGNDVSYIAPTSTVFTVATDGSVNASGRTYVAYLWAHDAGGFGLTGTDNVVSCGSYFGSDSGPTTVTLGYEPQWVMIKRATDAGDAYRGWVIFDTQRGMPVGTALTDKALHPHTAEAENPVTANAAFISPTPTGFTLDVTGSNLTNTAQTFIYIAIRRPMKVPTVGTSVFSPQVQTPSGAGDYVAAASSGFPIDWVVSKQKGVVSDWYHTSRLTNSYMSPNTTAAEASYEYGFDLMQGVRAAWSSNITVTYAFKRAPGFFDMVCATSSGYAVTATHNLGVVPELIIAKNRDTTSDWYVWSSLLSTTQTRLRLNSTNASANLGFGLNSVTASSFYAATGNTPTATQVFFLFATLAGVSKIGSYTGTATTKQIDCGFTSGARFVLIKRTDSTGDWYVWDTARGIIGGNDPYLLLNSTAAEDTSTDYIDTYNAGFELSSTAPSAINANGGTYIFLAIA